MTYERTFKLCRNHKDLYYKYVELRDKGHDVMSPEFLSAYKKRFEELTMTYQGLFAKCKTIDDARALKKKLIAEASDNFRRMQELEIEQAYRKRREELRNEVSVAN